MTPTPTHRSLTEDAADIVDGWLRVVSARHRPFKRDVHPDHEGYGLDLVLLDMDGTVTRDPSSWQLLHAAFEVDEDAHWHDYRRGEITDEELLRRDIELLCANGGNLHLEDIERVLAATRLMDNARPFVDALRARGVATCILSGGLDLVAKRVCDETGIDLFVANGLRLERSGHLQGEGLCLVRVKDKGPTTREILAALDVKPARVAAVGNSAFDVPMFREVGLGVAFAPSDPVVRHGADVTVASEDMLDILPHLDAYAAKNDARDQI